jgi:hypothetical protein
VVWLAVHYSVGAGADELPHPMEAWALRLHGALAFVGLFFFGAVSAGHVEWGWRMSQSARFRPQRRSGLGLCALALGLSLSGYLLYYFAPETLRPGMGWLHAAIGVVMAAVLVWHRRRAPGGAAFGFRRRRESA